MVNNPPIKVINDIILLYETNKNPKLKDVIRLLSGYNVIPFNRENLSDITVLENLKRAADLAVDRIRESKIVTKRANEVGNKVESFIRDAICDVGYNAQIPSTAKGLHKSTGYPDIVFWDKSNQMFIAYIECKTYNIENIDTTQRSFYLSPSDNFKITADAHHFVISIEIVEEKRDKDKNIYSATGWKILDISELPMNLKLEFNSDNRSMYRIENNLVLAEKSSQIIDGYVCKS